MKESKFKKFLFNELTFALAIASAVFWFMNYVNSPITKMQLDLALLQKDIQIITTAHLQYGDEAHRQALEIVEINNKLTRILTILGK